MMTHTVNWNKQLAVIQNKVAGRVLYSHFLCHAQVSRHERRILTLLILLPKSKLADCKPLEPCDDQ